MNRTVSFVALTLVIGTALFVSGCISRSPDKAGLDIGKPAPSFKLPDLNGREVSLDQFKGKVVLLDFWATWCGPCRMSMPMMEKLQKEYKNDLVLLAINLQESKDVVREYVVQQGLDSHVLLDESGSVGTAYDSGQIPTQVLIDKQGILRHYNAGFSPRLVSQLRSQIEQLR